MLHLLETIKAAEAKAAQCVADAEARAKQYAAAVEDFLGNLDAVFNAGDATKVLALLVRLESLMPAHVALGGTAEVLQRVIAGVRSYQAYLAAQPKPATQPATPASGATLAQ